MDERPQMQDPHPRRLTPRAWRLFLLAAPVFAIGYLALPANGPLRTMVYPVFGLVAMATILVAIRLARPSRPRSWSLIAGAAALFSGGDISYSLLSLGVELMPYPSQADLFYLAGYVTLAAGLTGLARGRMRGGDRMPLIDGAILASGAASVFWVAIMRPSIEGTADLVAVAVSLAYPALDIVLLGLAFRVVLSSSRRPAYLHLFTAGLVLYFAADVLYALALLDGSYVDGHPLDTLWIAGVTLWAAAALHPSASDPITNVEPKQSLGRSRLAMLAVAALMSPGILLLSAVDAADGDAIGLIVTWTVLFGLVLLRLASTVDELGMSLRHRRRLQADLVYQANHDPLTRLANRSLFEDRLGQAVALRPTETAVVFFDLDDFKAINDTLGHASGDELLRVLATRVARELRPTDLAARLGGDEFAILVERCPDEATARLVAGRILGALRAPVELNGRQLQARGSAGIAMGRPGLTPTDLMRNADVAMYEAKSHGKDQAETYEPAMHGRIVRSYELRTELSEAIEQGQFEVHYQPAVMLATDEVLGAEALVRWRHPERGLLSPGEFIPLAESSGAIHDLGRWILREACATAASWPLRSDGLPASLSVNLAPSQLRSPTIVDDVRRILRETGLAPERLFLEVTESALVDAGPATVALTQLRDLGLGLALDDFGTGYSALSYLATLPFDIVKIDRGFTAAAGEGQRLDDLLEGIIGLCRSLELITIAEGIEEEHQLARVRALGCVLGQGYLFARPMPADAFASLYAASGPRPGSFRPPLPKFKPRGAMAEGFSAA